MVFNLTDDRGVENRAKQVKRQHTGSIISFSNDDLHGVQTQHDPIVVVIMTITSYNVKKILVDNGSSINMLFYDIFQKMKLFTDQLKKVNTLLVRFSRNFIVVEGEITLAMIEEPQIRIEQLTFLVVCVPSAYNAILRWPELNILRAAVSMYYFLMRFLTRNGVGEV